MRARVDGPFRVADEDGADLTPKGMKERALLALLILSPGQRRTRAWLQDKLWSDRDPAQASGSCRQALSNLRKALGGSQPRLKSDRTTVWIDPPATLDDRGEGDLLGDLDVRDPEFDDWLRDLRQQRTAGAARPLVHLPRPATQRPMIAVNLIGSAGPAPMRSAGAGAPPTGAARAGFLLRALGSRIAGELMLMGGVDVVQCDQGAAGHAQAGEAGAGLAAIIEIAGYAERGCDYAVVQTLGAPSRRLAWTGRLALDGPISAIWEAEEATRVVNRAVQAVADVLATSPDLRPLAALNRAVRSIYEFDRSRLTGADAALDSAAVGDLNGLALAWRGFLRLTYALEFRDMSGTNATEAVAFAENALKAMGQHPVVLALASQVRLKVTGDLDAAHYLAVRAAEISDQNPYALDALSQSLIMLGDHAQADVLAARARRAAQGLANSFSWDMQACLSALSVGRIEAACDAARECHRKMPFYRPALRYLVALSYLLGRREDALAHATRLRRLEPDFEPRLLLKADYPVDTLRALGLAEGLRSLIA